MSQNNQRRNSQRNRSRSRSRSRSQTRQQNAKPSDDQVAVQVSPAAASPTTPHSLAEQLFGTSAIRTHQMPHNQLPLNREVTTHSQIVSKRRRKLNKVSKRLLYSGHMASKITDPFRKKLYLLMEDPRSSWAAWVITMCVACIICFGVSVLIASSSTDYRDNAFWFPIEVTLAILFFIEYCVRLYAHASTRHRAIRFILSPLGFLDMLSWLPFALELAITQRNDFGAQRFGTLRIFRMFQLFRVYKDVNMLQLSIEMLIAAAREAAEPLLILIVFHFMSAIGMGVLLWYAERSTNNPGNSEQFDNIPICIYFMLYAMSNVGSPGLVPISVGGRLITFLAIGLGVLMTALPSVVVGRNYILIMMELQKYRPRTALEHLFEGSGDRQKIKRNELVALEKLYKKEADEMNKVIAEFYENSDVTGVQAAASTEVYDIKTLSNELAVALSRVRNVLSSLPKNYGGKALLGNS